MGKKKGRKEAKRTMKRLTSYGGNERTRMIRKERRQVSKR